MTCNRETAFLSNKKWKCIVTQQRQDQEKSCEEEVVIKVLDSRKKI